jgi:hypothetical protein
MDPITSFQELVGARAAYPLVAAILTFAIFLGKNSPYTKVAYAKIPEGWRWLLPVVAGGAMGFVKGYNAGYTWVGAFVETVFGITGVSATAMGLNAALKDSPIPWDGKGAGGKPLPPKPLSKND